jgi:hypothetical protein
MMSGVTLYCTPILPVKASSWSALPKNWCVVGEVRVVLAKIVLSKV